MAKLSDLEKESIFSPVHKDPERRAISLGLIVSLPSLLGVVSGTGNFIKGGMWRSLSEEIIDTYSKIVDEAAKNPATQASSGSKAKNVLMDKVNKLVNTQNPHIITTPSTIQQTSNIELIKRIINQPGTAMSHFGVDNYSGYFDYGPEGNFPFGLRDKMKTIRQVEYTKAMDSFNTWWHDTGKSRIDDLIGGGKGSKNKSINIRNQLIKSLNPKKGLQRIEPWETFNIMYEGVELGTIKLNDTSLENAFKSYNSIKDRLSNFNRKHGQTSSKIHERILELALQRTKASSLSTQGLGPWDSPTTFKSVNDPKFIAHLEKDEVFRENFYNNVEKLYRTNKNNTFRLPGALAEQSNPWKLSPMFTKDGAMNVGHLDHLKDSGLAPVTDNYDFSNSNIKELESKLKDSRTGLNSIQQRQLVLGNGGKYEALHKQLYNPVGDNASEILFGERRKAVELIKLRNAFKQEIGTIKNHVNSLIKASLSNDVGGNAAKRQIEELAKRANMTSGQYIEFIKHMDVKAEISADMYGGSAFKTANITITRKGFTDVKLAIPLTSKGAFVPNPGAKIHSSPLFMPNLAINTVSNAMPIDIAMIKKNALFASKYINDFVQSGYNPDKMYNLHKSFWGTFMEKTHAEVAGLTQNITRRSKLIVEELSILKGEASPRWYRKFAAGHAALDRITDIAQTHSTILTLDFEFNSKNTLGFDSTMGMVHNEHTRPYSASFIKSRGGKERIINHWIRPDNWIDIRDNVKNFMIEQHNKGSVIEFERIDALMKGANEYGRNNDGKFKTEFYLGKDNNGKWEHFSLKEFSEKRIPKGITVKKVAVYEEIGSFLEIAKSIFNTADGGTHFLTHGGEEADLVLWNKRTNAILDQIKSGFIRKVDKNDVTLLEKLAKETSPERLIARGTSLDTHSMASVVLAEYTTGTQFGLTDIYTKLVELDVSSKLNTSDDISKAMVSLGNLIPEHGNTKVSGKMKQVINLFPKVTRNYLKRWIEQHPQDAKELLSMGISGHHVSDFDTSITKLNQLLLSNRWEQIRRENPSQYSALKRMYEVAKQINSGRQLSHFHTMDLVSKHPLFQGDDFYGENDLRASLFSGSPNQASQANGYLLRMEKILPFGELANQQKQYYQVLSQRMLPDIKYDATQSLNIMTAKPILGHRMFTTSQMAALEEIQAMDQSARFGATKSVKTTRPLNILYLPSTNSIVGEDSALYANKKSMINNMNFTRSPIEKLNVKVGTMSNRLITKEAMKGRTLVEFMEQLAFSDRVIESVKRGGHGDLKLSEFIKNYSGDSGRGGAILDIFNHEQIVSDAIDDFTGAEGPRQTNKIGPNDSIFSKVRGVNIEGEGRRFTRAMRQKLTTGIQTEVTIRGLTYDTSSNMFIFNLSAIDTPSVSKMVAQLKKTKTMQVGMAANTMVGKGVELIAGMKKLDAAQLIDVQIRRVLSDLYRDPNIKTFTQQKTKVRNVLMKAFNLGENEIDQVFRINRSPVHHSQIGLFGTDALATVELIDSSLAKVESTGVMSNILKMLEEQGLTANKMKKMFKEQYIDVIHEAYSDTKTLDKTFIGKQLDKLFDGLYKQQKEGLDKWIKDQGSFNLSSEVGAAKQQASHAMRTIMKKGLSFYDLHILPNRSAMIDRIREGTEKGLTLEKILSEDVAKMADGKVLDHIYAAHSSFLITDEIGFMEDLTDVSKYKGVLKDFYGTPVKGSSTLWETLIRMEAVQGEALARNKFLPELIASFGWFNTNIKSSLEVHAKTLETLRHGYDLDKAKISQSNIYKMKYVQKGVRGYKFADDILRKQGQVWGVVKMSSEYIQSQLETGGHLNDTFIKNLLVKEFGEEYTTSQEFLQNKKQIIKDIRIRLMTGEMKNSVASLDGLHILNYQKNIGKKQFLSYELPDLYDILDEQFGISAGSGSPKKIDSRLSSYMKKQGFVASDKSLFFSHFRKALESAGNKEYEKKLIDNIKWLSEKHDGKISELIFPHLEHDGPFFDKESNRFKIYGESHAKLQVGRFIEEYGNKLESVAKEITDTVGKVGDEGLTDIQKGQVREILGKLDSDRGSFFKNVTKQYTKVMKGLSEAAWKSQRAYAPIMYGKAVDVALLMEQGLGGMLAKSKSGKIDILSKQIFHGKNVIVEALQSDKVRRAIVESGETIFKNSLNSEQAAAQLASAAKAVGGKNITYGDLFSNILGIDKTLPHESEAFRNALSMFTKKGKGYSAYAAKGMAIGEGIMSHSMFAELLKGGNPGALSSLQAIIDGNPDKFREVLAGKKGIREMFARAPLFENFFGARLRNVYLMPDEVYKTMGLNPNETKKIVAVSALDMLLHGGDFDGDLANTMLTKSSMFAKEYVGQSSNWKESVTDIERVKKWINLRIQQEGKAGLTIGGRHYQGIEEVNGRLLVHWKDGRKTDIADNTSSFFKFLDDPVEKTRIADRQRTYMLQQALTPIFGQKAKLVHTLFLGENPAVKTEVIDELSKKIGTLRGNEQAGELAQLLFDVGEISEKQQIELVESGKFGKLRDIANNYNTRIHSAWDWMQEKSNITLFEHNIQADGTTKIQAGKMGRTKFGVFYDWFNRALIHGVPIEKAKKGSLGDFYRMTAEFSKLTSGQATNAEIDSVTSYFMKTTPLEGARAESWFVGKNVDNGLSQEQEMRIRREAELEMKQTMRKFMRLQRASRVVSADGKPWGAYFTLSDTPKNAVFGAQVDLLSQEKGFIHSSLTNALLTAEQKGMVTDEFSSAFFMMDSLENEFSRKRTVVEEVTTWVKNMLSEGGKKEVNKWGKRALIGAAAIAIFDPNTNSMLLPDLEVNGEKYDIPSFDEISKSYKNRFATKVRGKTAPFLDKMAKQLDLPFKIGGKQIQGRYLPPNPNRVHYTTRERRDSILDIKEYARQVNGIMLGQ